MGFGRMFEVVNEVRATARTMVSLSGLFRESGIEMDRISIDLRDDARHDTLVVPEKEDT
jgi:hypothetical protein